MIGENSFLVDCAITDRLIEADVINTCFAEKGIRKAPEISKRIAEIVRLCIKNRKFDSERIGIIWAAQYPNIRQLEEYSMELQSDKRISAQQFAYSTAGSALGCVAIALGIKGFTFTINKGMEGVVQAIQLADMYIKHDLLDVVVVVAGDEYTKLSREDLRKRGEVYNKCTTKIGGIVLGSKRLSATGDFQSSNEEKYIYWGAGERINEEYFGTVESLIMLVEKTKESERIWNVKK